MENLIRKQIVEDYINALKIAEIYLKENRTLPMSLAEAIENLASAARLPVALQEKLRSVLSLMSSRDASGWGGGESPKP